MLQILLLIINKKRVELKWSLIIAQGRFRILNHTQCGLETFAWGGVWTFNRHWGRTADSISKLSQVSWTWVNRLGFYDSLLIPKNDLDWLVEVVRCGFHLLFNCFLMGLLGSSQRCKILMERHLGTTLMQHEYLNYWQLIEIPKHRAHGHTHTHQYTIHTAHTVNAYSRECLHTIRTYHPTTRHVLLLTHTHFLL